MKREPSKYNNFNGSSEFTARLQRLEFVRKLSRRVGGTAMKTMFVTQAWLQKDITLPSLPKVSSKFVESLTGEQSIKNILPRPPQATREELAQVIEKSNEVLASATTVFPLTIFPHTIVLDRTKLTITREKLLGEAVMSIRIEDILNVSAAVGPFFGSLTIATRVLSSDDHFSIGNLWRRDVSHMKRMIQGYVIARQNNITCDHLSRDELASTLQELGQDFHNQSSFRKTVSQRG